MHIKKYKGFHIYFEENKDLFIAYKDQEEIARAPSLRQLKKHLDVLARKAFKRLPIYNFNEDEILEGEITSFNSLEKEVWITYDKEKYRKKIDLEWGWFDVLHRTPENLQVLKQILSIKSQIRKLESRQEQLEDKLTSFTYKELCDLSGQNPVEE